MVALVGVRPRSLVRLGPADRGAHAGVDDPQGVVVHAHHGQEPLEAEDVCLSRRRVVVPPEAVAGAPAAERQLVLVGQLVELVLAGLAGGSADVTTGQERVGELALGAGVSLLQLLARLVVGRTRGRGVGGGHADVRQ